MESWIRKAPSAEDPKTGSVSRPVVGDTFEIRTRIGSVPADRVRVLIPELPEGIRRAENPTVVSRGRDTIEVRVHLIVDTAGRHIVEGIRIMTDQGIRDVEPVLVVAAIRRDGPIPLQGRWRVPEDAIVQSQSVPVVLSVIGAEEYVFPEEISFRAPDTGLFEEVRGMGEIITRSVDIYTLYDIPVAGFLFTPATAGEVTIPAAEIVIGDQTVSVRSRKRHRRSVTGYRRGIQRRRFVRDRSGGRREAGRYRWDRHSRPFGNRGRKSSRPRLS